MLDAEGLLLRAALFSTIRKFFWGSGFTEVDTPIRQPVCIPESNISPLRSGQYYLQTSPELCMKRLLASGCPKIFQICHCFRAEERGRLHLEEFQMLEWYREGAEYQQLMSDCENLLGFLFEELVSLTSTTGRESAIFPGVDLTLPWPRLSVAETFAKYSSISLEQAVDKDVFEEILVEKIEPHLGIDQPLFLYDYPLALGSLARIKVEEPQYVERFELYLNGVELANGFSELTDDLQQRERFQKEIDTIRSKGGDYQGMPEQFLQDLKKLDSAAGIAMGLDRLFMSVAGFQEISEAVTFSPDDF